MREASRGSHRQARGWQAVVWGGLVLLAVAGVVALNTEVPPLHTLRLTDGSQLSLVSVTRGRHHRFTVGKPAERRLEPLLPPDWVARLGWEVSPLAYESPGRDELVFWCKVDGANLPDAVTCLDEAGNETDSGLAQRTQTGFPTGYAAWTVPVFPRRGKRLGLRFWRQSESAVGVLGELWIPNPQPATGPSWTPDQLPLTAHTGDLEVTLLSLVSGVSASEPWRPAPDALNCGTRALLRVRERGGLPRHWQPVQITCSDANGNRWTADIWCPPGKSDPLVAVLPRLWPGEAAWKLRLGFIRNDGFARTDEWTHPRVRITPKALIGGARGMLGGASLEITSGAVFPPPTSILMMGTHVRNLPAGYRIDAVRATEAARNLTRSAVASIGYRGTSADRLDGPEGDLNLLVPFVGHPSTLDITFAIQKPRFVEFTVKPDILPARFGAAR